MSIAYLGMRNQIAENLGRYNYEIESVDTGTDRKILAAFNRAQDLVARIGEPPSLETTVTVYLDEDVYEYEFEDFDMSDCNHIYTIKLNDGTRYYTPMHYVIPAIFDQKIAPYIHNTSGKPEIYTVYNKTISFSRLPDSSDYTLDIRFRYDPAEILDTTSDCDIDEYEAVLVLLGTAFAWLAYEEVELYQEYRKLAAELLKPIKSDIRTEPTARSSSFVGANQKDYPSNYYSDPWVKRVR